MQIKKTEAIVISSVDYGESDRIVTLYTKDFGRVKGMAKGARRSRKRFANTLEPFTHIKTELALKASSGLNWINHSSLINVFFDIRLDIGRFIYGSVFLEIIDQMAAESHPVPHLFSLFLLYLHNLNKSNRPNTLMPVFALRLLSILGYTPYVSGCVICEKPLNKKVSSVFFSYGDGGIVCSSCRRDRNGGLQLSAGMINILQYVLTVPTKGLGAIALSSTQQKEILFILKGFIDYHLDKRLKSWELLEQFKV